MFRFQLVATATLLLFAVSQQQSSNIIENTFQDNILNSNLTLDNIRCTGFEGSAPTCIACYNCDNDKIKSRPPKTIKYLKLRDKNCRMSEVCCFSQQDLVPRENEECGKENPEGYPRARRPSLKAVLDRQYPWRAWVYSVKSGQSELLCAATYLHMGVRALVTTASCVNGQSPSSVVVKFTKTERTVQQVSRVIVHKDYVASTKTNDIAILTLSNAPDELVHPVCKPFAPALFGTSCISVSDSETYINEVIPQQKSCNLNDEGVMCVYSGSKGIKPQEGAGLFCLEEQSPIPKYLLHGVYLKDDTMKVGSKYTNLTYYMPWIKGETDKLGGARGHRSW